MPIDHPDRCTNAQGPPLGPHWSCNGLLPFVPAVREHPTWPSRHRYEEQASGDSAGINGYASTWRTCRGWYGGPVLTLAASSPTWSAAAGCPPGAALPGRRAGGPTSMRRGVRHGGGSGPGSCRRRRHCPVSSNLPRQHAADLRRARLAETASSWLSHWSWPVMAVLSVVSHW